MLGHGNTRAGDNKGRACRDIVRPLGVAARSTGIDGAVRSDHAQRFGAHGARGAGDFLDRLATDAQRHEESRDLNRRCLSGHHDVEGIGRLVGTQFGAGCDLVDEGFELTHGQSRGKSRGRQWLHRAVRPVGARCRPNPENWLAVRVQIRRRCSRDGTARHGPGGSCAAAP